MTREEFDQWIEQHYGELLAVAKQRIKSDPEDALQNAVAGMLASSTFSDTPISLVWPWAVAFVRYSAKDQRVSANRRKSLRTEAKNISRLAAPIHGWKRPHKQAE